MSVQSRQIGKYFIFVIMLAMYSYIAIGAYTDDTKLDTVFKHSVYAGWTTTDKNYYEETTPWNAFIHGDYVWLTDISDFDTSNQSSNVIEYSMVTMEEDVTVSGSRGWFNDTLTGNCIPQVIIVVTE